MSSSIGRILLNPKGLAYVAASLVLLYINHDVISEIFEIHGGVGDGDAPAPDRVKRDAPSTVQEHVEQSMIQNEDDPSGGLSRLARKILNESESYIEDGGKKRPISTKDLNKNYKEAKEAFLNPSKDCVPKPPAGAAGGGDAAAPAPPPAEEAPAEPPAERRRRRKREAKKLPYCEDLKKGGGAGKGGGGGDAAPPPPAEEPPAEPPAER